ncbi:MULTISPECIES: TetR family transcriptional regulator [Streptomyces]|uniref:TetR family transcriptional regulator n=1 Tax=Streptomyces TaxID=1883 RepID=UPI000B9DD67F|nr:TetR family transcriptional regulator [Streptomyces kasugaensis]
MSLFLESRYGNVTVREVTDAAGVATTTLLERFPSKESVVFDRNPDLGVAPIDAVVARPADVSILRVPRSRKGARVRLISVEWGRRVHRAERPPGDAHAHLRSAPAHMAGHDAQFASVRWCVESKEHCA